MKRSAAPKTSGLLGSESSGCLYLALKVGELRKKHYNRRTCDLSLADCFVLATAESGDSVVTGDSEIIKSAKKEKIKSIVVD